MRLTIRSLILLHLLAVMSLVPISKASSQDLLEDNGGFPKRYLVKLSGNVLRERFTDVRGLLSIAYPPPDSLNPYQIVVVGFPEQNSRNSFYWNSEFGFMSIVGTEVRCTLQRSYVKRPDVHFFYLSPILLESRIFVTQQEQERKRLAEKNALPTKVMAQTGELRVTFVGNQVSGTISVKGYDTIEQAYVGYSAHLSGRETTRLEPSLRTMK
jgi:hypothetical protein